MHKNLSFSILIPAFLLLIFAACSSASNIGETIPIEGIVDSAGRNSLYVEGKILVANEYSSINTGGTNIFIGDYVMGFIYLNDDMQSYTIVSLTKIPEKSIGTPTPLPVDTPTPVWADLFTSTPLPDVSQTGSLHLLSDSLHGDDSNQAWGQVLFGTTVPTATPVPASAPFSISFEGIVSNVSGSSIYIEGSEYITDDGTVIKNSSLINTGDYVRGRAAPVSGALLIRHIEVLEDYERPDVENKTVWGLYQGQDSTKMIISSPSGNVEALFYPETKMSKSFYVRGTLVSMDMSGSYVKTSADYPLVQSGDSISPVSGVIDEIVTFSENETYIVSSGLSYFADREAKFIPDMDSLEKGAPFVGVMRNGRILALYFTENNRVRTINGTAVSVNKGSDNNGIDFVVGGISYHITPDTIITGSNLVRHSEITGYADSSNNVFYLSYTTPWYSGFKDWNWTVIIPTATSVTALIFFLLLHRTKTEGFLQDVDGNLLTLTDARGENRRHFRCTDEIARYAGTLVTMKVELTVYHGMVIHIRYDF